MKRWSLRAKLTIWSAAVVGVAVLICGAGTVLYLQDEQMESVDRLLRAESKLVFRELREHSAQSRWNEPEQIRKWMPADDENRYYELLAAGGKSLYRSANLHGESLARFDRPPQTVEVAHDRVRLDVFQEDSLTLFVAADLDDVDAETGAIVASLGVGLPLLLGVVAFGGWWLARTALAPIREFTEAAEKITAFRLDQRLPITRTSGEIGRLGIVLNQTFDRLEKSFHQGVRFSADASHELKTPLAVLRASIEDLLESASLGDADRKAVSTLLEQTQRLSSITHSLLLLSRADAGQLRLDPKPANVSELVAACVEDASVMAEGKQIAVKAEIPERLHRIVDAARLGQILLNLLDNAVKYNRDHGAVQVTAESSVDGIRILVENTGRGILPQHAPQLFKRFYRGSATSDTPGSGLGLSLARELARAHGGDVLLLRSDSEWTTFELRIHCPAPGDGSSVEVESDRSA